MAARGEENSEIAEGLHPSVLCTPADSSEATSCHRRAQPPIEFLEVERAFQAALKHRQYNRALETIIAGYGGAILGYLWSREYDQARADDIYGMFLEDIVRGIKGFRGDATARSWAYTIARNARCRYHRSPQMHYAHTSLTGHREVQELADRIRSGTWTILKTTFKRKVRDLHLELSELERDLLTFRIDREMSWREIAVITLGAQQEGTEDGLPYQPTREEIEKESIRLRKIFSRAKVRLRQLTNSS